MTRCVIKHVRRVFDGGGGGGVKVRSALGQIISKLCIICASSVCPEKQISLTLGTISAYFYLNFIFPPGKVHLQM